MCVCVCVCAYVRVCMCTHIRKDWDENTGFTVIGAITPNNRPGQYDEMHLRMIEILRYRFFSSFFSPHRFSSLITRSTSQLGQQMSALVLDGAFLKSEKIPLMLPSSWESPIKATVKLRNGDWRRWCFLSPTEDLKLGYICLWHLCRFSPLKNVITNTEYPFYIKVINCFSGILKLDFCFKWSNIWICWVIWS